MTIITEKQLGHDFSFETDICLKCKMPREMAIEFTLPCPGPPEIINYAEGMTSYEYRKEEK